ncbi:hypothetical protein D9611_013468 [Ephemerocybe angulata]|uniref:Uncharacterized protein n=1 Tax=Ephemerocybe angulata TaxID=980116 RepID=A0A8H5BT00_9AGAR|nr:hypothetical protein D9611_013468 [Tulosesus angulatus]
MPRTAVEWVVIAIAFLLAEGQGPTLKWKDIADTVLLEARNTKQRISSRLLLSHVLWKAFACLHACGVLWVSGAEGPIVAFRKPFGELSTPEIDGLSKTKIRIPGKIDGLINIFDVIPDIHSLDLHDMASLSTRRSPRRSPNSEQFLQSVHRSHLHDAQIRRFYELVVVLDLEDYDGFKTNTEWGARVYDLGREYEEEHARILRRAILLKELYLRSKEIASETQSVQLLLSQLPDELKELQGVVDLHSKLVHMSDHGEMALAKDVAGLEKELAEIQRKAVESSTEMEKECRAMHEVVKMRLGALLGGGPQKHFVMRYGPCRDIVTLKGR